MPKKKLQKSLQDYLSKIKSKPTPNIQNPKKFILSGCKYPKTRSFAVDRTRTNHTGNNNDDEAALADIDRFLFENFKSLYLRDEDGGNENVKDKKGKSSNIIPADKESYTGGVLFDSPRFLQPPRDLCGSARFFVGAGSSSGSLVEDARSSTTSTAAATTTTTTTATTVAAATTSGMSFTESMDDNGSTANDGQKEVKLPEDCIAVLAQSSSPYDHFRLSMREMVDARLRSHGRADWEFMEEILFCYLNLNEKKSHKYILNAFVDLIVALRRSNGRTPARQQAEAGRGARESRRSRARRDIVT